MEINPAYVFGQQDSENLDKDINIDDDDEEIYMNDKELKQINEDTESYNDELELQTGNNSIRERRKMEASISATEKTEVTTTVTSQPKVQNKERGMIVNIVFGISILGLLVLAVTAILISVLMATNSGSNQEIQSLREELEYQRVMLNQTGEDSNNEIQSLQKELENQRAMLNQAREDSNNEIQFLQEELENQRAMLNQTKEASNNEIQSLREELENQRVMLNQTGEDFNYVIQLETANLRKLLNQTENLLALDISSLRADNQAQYNNVTEVIETLTERGSIINPARSCEEIPSDSLPGEHWITDSDNQTLTRKYCDAIRRCGDNTTEWTRVAYVDMTDPNQQCPNGLTLVTRNTAPLRTCARANSAGASCASVTFPVNGKEYSYVYGQIKAYQDGTPDGFFPYYANQALTIDDLYVNGVSLTYGRIPRQHIWTFVAVPHEQTFHNLVCPCTRPAELPFTGAVPPFIGQDYFCETGIRDNARAGIFYADDPLWNGQGCGIISSCCSFNNPPWFCKQLPEPTTDDIELRLCLDQGDSDEEIPIELIEIYIQ